MPILHHQCAKAANQHVLKIAEVTIGTPPQNLDDLAGTNTPVQTQTSQKLLNALGILIG